MKNFYLRSETKATLSILMSAILFAFCIPFAKLLENHISSVYLGGFLYLGAGVGIFITTLVKHGDISLYLTRKDFPFIIAMVLLDISAIILLMLGIARTTGANAVLTGSFELAATSLAAYFLFKEHISKKLWCSILLITIACVILGFEARGSFIFNPGTILVLLSAICWGLENNCTRKLSIKDTRKITIIKGIFSGLGSLIIALLMSESVPEVSWILPALCLGFFAYGISITLYIYAQRYLGAAKTALYYSMTPFFGIIFSMLILGERPALQFYIALLIMIAGVVLVVGDNA